MQAGFETGAVRVAHLTMNYLGAVGQEYYDRGY